MGAGLGGLLVAWRARAAGEDVVVHEAAEHVGGETRTAVRDGWRVEHGAWFLPGAAPAQGLSLAAAGRLGLRPLLGRVAQAGPRGLTPLWTPARRRRAALRDGLAPRPRAVASSAANESLESFARRRFGPATTEDVVRPVAQLLTGFGPERVGIADALPAWLAREARHGRVGVQTFAALDGRAPLGWTSAGGLAALVERLRADLGACVQTACRVVEVVPGGDPSSARVVDEAGATSAPGTVTLAVPHDEQVRLLRRAAPALADQLAGERGVDGVRVVIAWTHGEDGPATPPYVAAVRGRSRLRVRGVLFPAALDVSAVPDTGACAVAWLGGAHDPHAAGEPEGKLVRRVLADLALVLGRRVRPHFVEVQRRAGDVRAPWPGRRARLLEPLRALAGAGVELVERPAWRV
ncbi:MAG: NAD(P)/FAD-dependent oxidoreductase [Planctomycetota bacterium]